MALLTRDTGELTFADGFVLTAGLAVGELAVQLDGRLDAVVRLPSHAVAGGRIVPICTVESGTLHSVALCPSAVGGKSAVSPSRQRSFLFARLGLRDPFPDTLESVCIYCPFGEILIGSDPHTGRAEARLMYAVR